MHVGFRWREEQMGMRASHIASSMRSMPTNIEKLEKDITHDYGEIRTRMKSLHTNGKVMGDLYSVE